MAGPPLLLAAPDSAPLLLLVTPHPFVMLQLALLVLLPCALTEPTNGCAADCAGGEGNTCFPACPECRLSSPLCQKTQAQNQMLVPGRICSNKTNLNSVAAHISPYSPHCLSQCLTCNGEQSYHINMTFQDHSSSSRKMKIHGIMEDPTWLMRL